MKPISFLPAGTAAESAVVAPPPERENSFSSQTTLFASSLT
jgi:hypothetical protein